MAGGGVFLPGVELALLGSLLLEDSSVFKLHWTGDEPDFTAFLHQAPYPPVIVEFLHEIIHVNVTFSVILDPVKLRCVTNTLTSLTWRKSLASKEMAMPGTGTSSS